MLRSCDEMIEGARAGSQLHEVRAAAYRLWRPSLPGSCTRERRCDQSTNANTLEGLMTNSCRCASSASPAALIIGLTRSSKRV